ncbi:MAG: DNA translocase FtsK 4TM domain-containing protein, partial [Rubrivivax sp.]
MTFPLGSLGIDGDAGGPATLAARPRWRHQLMLVGGALAWGLLMLALLTYDPADAAFTTSGEGEQARNAVGRLGASVVDLLYFLLGYSAWWLMPVTARAWWSSLRVLRRQDAGAPLAAPASGEAPPPRWLFWAGLALLLAASTALEWTRLYRFESSLPGHAGGILGWALGTASLKWLGFTGSGVAWIVALVLGVSLSLRFSWLRVAEGVGTLLETWRERRAARREQALDAQLGAQAQAERERVVAEEQREIVDHLPLVIEPAVVEVPKSERVAKERQKPLFAELVDTKLPQVDLLDASPGRQESVSPESLEMTSRLIEKKLKDFGVEVRVVAASPGPVITRYEIEPATGVKGSQVVGLAKDLARSLSLVSIRVVEVVPGKNYMALELPNARRQTIRLAEILGSTVYNDAASMLTLGLGKDIIGNPVVADLAKMPHVLVAGTTGSGKSVGINAMILSLLYKAEARDVRLILIDPKMLEMSVYEGIPHLL